ncbi:YycH family regulatory protein [Ornithinibacillus sp. 179-J 7C1 HS]|uniref:YycH family regulatory protein n=1 Tax=Ornithinibacillus sp. 179-J 7C1 HS TaxID=3142384 RepID=UPI00399F28E3
MNIELLKTYALAILVGISLILTYSLWSHTPNNETLEEEHLLDPSELNLGGTEETRKTLVQPSHIIFKKWRDNYFGFANPEDKINLYEDMTSWVLYNFRVSDANGRPNVGDKNLVEMIFPVKLPMEIIPSLFTINNQDSYIVPENLYFQRVYITMDESDKSMTFIFLTVDGKQQLSADVNNTQKYELVDSIIRELNGLEEYVMLEPSEYPVYVPIQPTEMRKYTLRFNELPYTVLKNALFPDPSSVIENVTADQILWYQDGPRSMQVFGGETKMNMEYIMAQNVVRSPMTILDIIDRSITTINGFKGWTHDYQLEQVNTTSNEIQYLMHYKGYPVFNLDNLSVIEQRFANNELIEHRQPLYKLDFAGSVQYDIPPGNEVIDKLKSGDYTYKVSDIQDIRIGYRLSLQIDETNNYVINLTPEWYIKVNNRWQQFQTEEKLPNKGVS